MAKSDFRIKVGSSYWTVSRVANLEADGIPLFGQAVNLTKEIKLRAGMQPEQEAQVLLHELLHAVCSEYCVSDILDEDEETVVDLIATGLTHAFKSTPDALAYLQKQLGA